MGWDSHLPEISKQARLGSHPAQVPHVSAALAVGLQLCIFTWLVFSRGFWASSSLGVYEHFLNPSIPQPCMKVFNMNVQLGCAHEYEMHECAIFSYYVFNEYEICSYGFFT